MNGQELENLYKRLDKIEATLETVTQILNKLQGAGTFVKLTFVIGAPFAGLILWMKDHVKW
jgi:tetrahydromethanopterin S-methyltransferase subunit G